MADICASTITKNLGLGCNSCPCSFPYHICVFDQHSTFNSHNISWNSCFIGVLLLLYKLFCPIVWQQAANSSLKQYRAESWHYKRPRNAWVVTVCHRHSSCAFKASIWTAQHHCTMSVFCEFHSGLSVNSYSNWKSCHFCQNIRNAYIEKLM